MIQVKFSLESQHIQFLNQFKEMGYRDKSAMVREALEYLKKKKEQVELETSAALVCIIIP